MIKDALAKLDEIEGLYCKQPESSNLTNPCWLMREILVSLGEVNLVVFPDTYRDELRKINKSFEDIERRVEGLEKSDVMHGNYIYNMTKGKTSQEINTPETYRSKCGKCGNFFDHKDPLRLYCFSCTSPEVKEEQPCVHSRCAYSIISGVTVWTCSDCYASWINDDIIHIPRAVAEKWFDATNKYGIMHEGVEKLYLAIKQALNT